jgi:hypothetical protein
MEWKRDGDNNGGGEITELLKAPPANTSSKMGLSHTSDKLIEKQQLGERVGSIQTAISAGEMEQEGIELTLRAYRLRLTSVSGYLHMIRKIVLFANSVNFWLCANSYQLLFSRKRI